MHKRSDTYLSILLSDVSQYNIFCVE